MFGHEIPARSRKRLLAIQKRLEENPPEYVNHPPWGNCWTLLHYSAEQGDIEVIRFLLRHPRIDVNRVTSGGSTSLLIACANQRGEVMDLLLADPRVDVNICDLDGWSPVWSACHEGSYEMLLHMVASGRDFDWTKPGRDYKVETSPLEAARTGGSTRTSLLMEDILRCPPQARFRARLELRLPDALAAQLFACVVFLCDNFLTLKPDPSRSLRSSPALYSSPDLHSLPALLSLPVAHSLPVLHSLSALKSVRFFTMTRKLPMELQMALCHLVFDTSGQNVPSRDSEPAFRFLALTFQTCPVVNFCL